MTARELAALLRRLGACREARRWARGKTLAQAWARCPRTEWMRWLLSQTVCVLPSRGERRRLLAAWRCWNKSAMRKSLPYRELLAAVRELEARLP